MTVITMRKRVPMGAAEYWPLLQHHPFEVVQGEVLGMKRVEELDSKIGRSMLYRTSRQYPVVPLPDAILKLLGKSELCYTDKIEKCLDSLVLRGESEPPVFKNSIHISSVLRLEPIDENSCTQILELTVQFNVWGVGRLLETIVAHELKKSYSKVPEIVRRWKETAAKDTAPAPSRRFTLLAHVAVAKAVGQPVSDEILSELDNMREE